MDVLNKSPKDEADVKEKKVAVKKIKKAAAPKENNSEKKVADPTAFRIIKHPRISEKATDLSAMNKYVFIVPLHATKSQIILTIKNLYGVKPTSVNTISVAGKQMWSRRHRTKKSDFKKAIVSFPKDQRIEVYEGV